MSMELMVRCALPDRPGELAKIASAISASGGDIQAVDVVEHSDGRVLDDIELLLDPDQVSSLLARLRLLDGVEVIHAGPSRGRPGDAVTRLSIGIESLLDGSAEARRGLRTLIGGLLHARSAEFVDPDAVPHDDPCSLVLDAGSELLVLQRDYRFTSTERQRAEALLRLAVRAIATVSDAQPAYAPHA
jgi:hypothetical protein